MYQTKRARGPPGWVMLGGVAVMSLAGLWYYHHDAQERMYVPGKGSTGRARRSLAPTVPRWRS